ncbi:MAG: hypothetical protein ACP5N7_00445 [Candidatus Pacearchaeota archaeon]
MTINERKLKIVGTANIPTDLTNGKNYDLVIKNAEVRGISEDPNDDGTVDRTHKLKLSELSEVAIVDGRDILKAKVKGSLSKRQRYELQLLYEALGYETDFEIFYNERMSKNISEIINERESIC